jgi:hypothetical protein
LPPGRQRARPCRAGDRSDGHGRRGSAAHGPTGRATPGNVTHDGYSRVTQGWGSGPLTAAPGPTTATHNGRRQMWPAFSQVPTWGLRRQRDARQLAGLVPGAGLSAGLRPLRDRRR